MRFRVTCVLLAFPLFAGAQSVRLGVQGGAELSTFDVVYPAPPSFIAGGTSTLELNRWLVLRVDLQLSERRWAGARALNLETPAIVEFSVGQFGDNRPYVNAGYLRTVALRCALTTDPDALNPDTRRVLTTGTSSSTGVVGHDPLTVMRTSNSTSCMDVLGSSFDSGFLLGAGIAMRRRGGETAVEIRSTHVRPQFVPEQFRGLPFAYPRAGVQLLLSTSALLR